MLTALIAVMVASPLSKPCPDDAAQRISLGVGTQKILTVAADAKYRFAPSGPIEIKEISMASASSKRQLLLIGAQEGDTVITIESTAGVLRYRVSVEAQGCDLGSSDVRRFFPCGSTMRLKLGAERLEIWGTASSLGEWIGARRVQAEYPHTLITGKLDPAVLDWTIGEANAALTKAGLTGLHFVKEGAGVLLEGDVASAPAEPLAAVLSEWREKLASALWKPKNLP